jgi:hypothetical protein
LANVRRVVLDVLKPHSPSMVDLANQLADLDGVDGVNLALLEMDQKVENVKITCEGEAINFEEVEKIILRNGATIHSLDEVSSGMSLIEEVATSQD